MSILSSGHIRIFRIYRSPTSAYLLVCLLDYKWEVLSAKSVVPWYIRENGLFSENVR